MVELLLAHYYSQQKFEEFTKSLQRTIPFFEKTHPIKFVANKYLSLGNFLVACNKIQEAKENYHKAESRFKSLNNTVILASVYMHLSKLHLNLGEYETSMDFSILALDLFELNKDILDTPEKKISKTDYGSVFETLAILFGKMNQKEKSREYFNKAIEVFQQTKFYQGEIQCLQNIGVTYSEEEPNKTISYYLNALELAQKTDFYNLRVAIINNIGGVYEDISKYDQALNYYNQALELAKSHQVKTFISIK